MVGRCRARELTGSSYVSLNVLWNPSCIHASQSQGKDAIAFLETLVVGDVAGLAPGTGSLSVFTNERGGTIDDTVVTKARCACSTPDNIRSSKVVARPAPA